MEVISIMGSGIQCARFENGINLNSQQVQKIAKEVYQTLKRELPDEMQTFQIFQFLLNECKHELDFQKIRL